MPKKDKKEKGASKAFENFEPPYKWEDKDERRGKALALHTRGKTVREIAQKMGVSHGTIARDIKIAKESGIEEVESFNREEYVTETIAGYKDIIREAWTLNDNPDPEVRIKALNMVRLTLKDLRQALQDTGPLKKVPQNAGGDQVNLAIIGNWTEKNVEEAVVALLGSRLPSRLQEPEPPEAYENEIIDIEENSINKEIKDNE